VDQKIIKKISAIVGADQITTAKEELLCYSYDGTGREFIPSAVAFPGSTHEISQIMQLANSEILPVVIRGAGTGMTGGALPVAGGLVLAMSRMNKIIEIDAANQIAVVEPGVITGELRQAAAEVGLYYPPDPASYKFCTMGGNVAECAGGPSAVKYGVTRDYVLGLEAVLADGRVITTGVRTAKGVVGYDLTRLLVGSEGTLAVITKIIVKLIAAPAGRETFLVLCPDMGAATGLVAKILGRLTPCTLEYLDRTAIAIVNHKLPFPLPETTGALLLIELDGDPETLAVTGRRLNDFLNDQSGVIETRHARSREEAEQLWAARRSVSPAAFSLKPDKISEDVVVPKSLIPELVSCTERLGREQDLTIFTFGHAGDGNIHVNIMLDKSRPEEVARAERAKRLLFTEVLKLGGTLSGEHGVGITKADYLGLEISDPTLGLMRQVKTMFDPNNILNPGKIFPAAPESKNN